MTIQDDAMSEVNLSAASSPAAGLEKPTADPSGPPTGGERPGGDGSRTIAMIARSGLAIAFVVAVVGFGLARPDVFFTLDNLRSVLLQAAAPTVLAVCLTLPLALGDFDLSIGSMVGLGGASAVAMMALHGSTWQVAILVGLGLGVLAGLVNGFIVSVLGASSFVITLAMSTVLLGVEYLFTNQTTLYTGIQPGYISIGQSTPFWGINAQVWIALAVAVVAWVFLDHTETGRYMYAIGGNPDAARFAGVRVTRLRIIGFVVVAVGAAFTGILITAQGASSSPNAGVSYLLPAYAAAFLGSAAFRPGQFNIAGTVLASVFLGVIQTGLQILQISTAVINILQGAILAAAILISRLERKRA